MFLCYIYLDIFMQTQKHSPSSRLPIPLSRSHQIILHDRSLSHCYFWQQTYLLFLDLLPHNTLPHTIQYSLSLNSIPIKLIIRSNCPQQQRKSLLITPQLHLQRSVLLLHLLDLLSYLLRLLL